MISNGKILLLTNLVKNNQTKIPFLLQYTAVINKGIQNCCVSWYQHFRSFNPFHANGHFLYSLKTTKKPDGFLIFSGAVERGHRYEMS